MTYRTLEKIDTMRIIITLKNGKIIGPCNSATSTNDRLIAIWVDNDIMLYPVNDVESIRCIAANT